MSDWLLLFINRYVKQGIYRPNGGNEGKELDYTSLPAMLKALNSLQESALLRVTQGATFETLINQKKPLIPTVAF